MSFLSGRSVILCLATLLALAGCGKDGKDKTVDNTPPAALGEMAFTLPDLNAPLVLRHQTSNEIRESLSNLDFTLLAPDYKFVNLGNMTLCTEKGLGRSVRTSSTEFKNGILSLTISGDLTECYVQFMQKKGATNVRALTRYEATYEIMCSDVELFLFGNISLAVFDFRAQRDCPNGYKYRTTIRHLVSSRFEVQGQPFESQIDKLVTHATNDLGFCETVAANGISKSSGCVHTSKIVEKGSFPGSQYTRMVDKDLEWVQSDKKTWYSSGTVELQLDDWSGVINYLGSDVKPVYALKNATEVVNGVIPGS